MHGGLYRLIMPNVREAKKDIKEVSWSVMIKESALHQALDLDVQWCCVDMVNVQKQ